MKNNFLNVAVFAFVLMLLSSAIYAQTTEDYSLSRNLYIKTSQDISASKNDNICQIRPKVYLTSERELSNISPDDIVYMSPIWKNNQTNQEYAVDNSIILYGVTNLHALINNYDLSQRIISLDSIDGNPTIYVLTLCSMSHEQIVTLCNVLQNSSDCMMAEPNYITFRPLQNDISPNPEGNTYYSEQWGLNYNLYPNFDINARNAWRITTGENVKVAVIDGGFELGHPDLEDNIYLSYDCTDGGDGAQNGSYMLSVDSHGTKCAGVVGAINNDIGIIGVAPDSKLILLRRGYSTYYGGDTIFITYTDWHINALRKAYQFGADVISNSWSMANPNTNNYDIFDAVLEEAYTYGRSGNGSVIVFSTGNQSKTFINYPSNSPYTIAVGAMNNMGQKTSWSNYGQDLDVVAPGANIVTTNVIPRGSYCYASGTSFAAPMVAGVAALILSTTPELTAEEVGNIIRSTAYKLPAYHFNTSLPCGTWNDSVGYGLVDAEAAVIAAAGGYIQGQDYICNTDTVQFHLLRPSLPGETVTWSVNSGPFSFLQEYFIVGSTHNDSVWVRRNSPNSGIGQQKPLVPPTISVTITNGTTSKTYTKEFRLPHTSSIPSFTASNTSSGWAAGTTRTFTITNCTDVPDYMFRWEVMKIVLYPAGTDTTYEDFDGRTLHYTPSIPVNVLGSITIKAINTKKECGTNWSSSTYGLYNPSILLTAQPEGNTLYINILEETEEELRSPAQLKQGADYSLELWHSLYGRMCTQVVQSTAEQINISGYPQGVYVLLLKENDNIIAQTKLIIQ